MAYDLVSRQSRISFAVQRKPETGLPSFGERLKQEREKRKITLEEISSSTKIGTRMLQALEEDKFNQLPGGIFNKGFVRAYSRFVGLDEDQTVAEYLEASGDAPPVSTEIAAREDVARENAETVRRLEASASDDGPGRSLPWGWFAAVLLVIALALSLWSRHRRESVREPLRPAAITTATQSPVAAVAGEVPGNDRDKDSGATSPGSASPAGNSGLPIASNPPPGLSAAGPAAPGEFTVDIQTREESWISLTVDGKAVAAELLPAGSQRTVHGRKEVVVKAGNSGGVDFRFNGKKLDFGGGFGEVKTITFGPQGLSPNAPGAPSTP
jgi:cytoskeletal protein RodZ